MADPKLKLGNDIWATKQKSLLAYNDEGGNFKSLPFQVDRISGGTYVGRNGLIQSAASNEPRIDFTSNTKGALLLEPQRTNYLLNSNDASQWSTFISNGTITRDDNYSIAPDGTLTATRLQASVTGSGYALLFPRTSILTSGSYSLSVYVKSNTQSNQEVAFYGIGTTISNYTVTGEWQRLELTGTASGQAYFLLGILTENAGYTNPIDILVWGGQLEAGTYATSIIPTSSAAVTRVVDTCESGENLSNLINNSEGTLFVDFEFFEQGTTSLYQMPIGLFNSGGSGSQNVRIDNYSGKLRIYIVSSSGTRSLWDSSNSISNVVANQRYKVAIRYKNGDCASYVNGELYKSDSGGVSGFNLVKMVFGYANFGNTLMHRGKINDTKLYDSGLTNAELATLTTI